ncbi:MAG: DNA-binding response regulator [Bacteroidetes bacterium]|nr:MAG: DNA-binding response regulator [Bacteroidota bacterium]
MSNLYKIFLVEDDPNFGGVLKSYLEMDDFKVNWIDDGLEAVSAFEAGKYDICILDIMLPNLDGFSIARKIKQVQNDIPLIFLTAKTLKEDVLQGYKIGADDYITKPFDSEVLIYKIKAILKRDGSNYIKSAKEGLFTIGEFDFNYPLRQIIFKNQIQKLSPKEAELLKMLCLAKGEIMSRKEALITIWDDDNYFTTRSMDVYISKLRKYLKKDSSIEIENIHSSGYRLRVNE